MIFATLIIALSAVVGGVQAGQVPPSTNPANRVIYAADGQDAVHQGEGVWVFSGVESHRAWSLLIADRGQMTLSVTTDGAVWSVFGSALPEG